MLARLQKLTTLALIAAALGWAAIASAAGHPGWALSGALLALFGYALVLGAEFCLMTFAHGADPAPRPTRNQLVHAWWAEVLAGPRIFCWQQPFRSRRWADHLPANAGGRRGVLLVHGFVCNRGFWNRWLELLTADDVPAVAVNLEPVFGSIDDYVAVIEAAVRRLELCTGAAPIVVAHSMGGLALRRWYAAQPEATRIAHIITIGSPHHGTWLARFALSANGREMQRGSPWLGSLARRESDQQRSARFTCFYGHCDNIVFPPSTATLPGAENRHLEGTPHVHMADHPEPWSRLQLLLYPADTATTTPSSTPPAVSGPAPGSRTTP